MNMIICNEKCRHQKEGYCALTGMAQITNALASPCCYYEGTHGKSSSSDRQSGVTGYTNGGTP